MIYFAFHRPRLSLGFNPSSRGDFSHRTALASVRPAQREASEGRAYGAGASTRMSNLINIGGLSGFEPSPLVSASKKIRA